MFINITKINFMYIKQKKKRTQYNLSIFRKDFFIYN